MLASQYLRTTNQTESVPPDDTVDVTSTASTSPSSTAPPAPDSNANVSFKITASDGAANDEFGYSVYADGFIAVVGAPFDGDNETERGSA